MKLVQRSRQQAHSVILLLDQIFLFAAPIGVKRHLFGRKFPIIVDGEQTPGVDEQVESAPMALQILPQDDKALFLVARNRRLFRF